MTATLVPPTSAPRALAPRALRTNRRQATVRNRATSFVTLRRRHRSLGIREAWRLLSDDPPAFGDDPDGERPEP